MVSIDQLLDDLLRHEGGFTADPKDRAHYGKARPPKRFDCTCTNMGITQETLSLYYGRQATNEEVRSLSAELAREIYERLYLTGPRIDTMSPILVPVLFDTCVHSGARRAVTMLQEVLNQAGFGPVSTDGAIGPNTRKAASRAADEMGAWLVNAYVEQRRQFLLGLIEADPSQQRFEKGWMNRIASFEMPVEGT